MYFTNQTIYSCSDDDLKIRSSNPFYDFLELDQRQLVENMSQNHDHKGMNEIDSFFTKKDEIKELVANELVRKMCTFPS